MPTETHETYDGNGNLLSTRQVEIPPEEWNRRQLFDKAKSALTANATYLALATPTAAQNVAQIATLTKECNALIRLLLGSLDDISGT